MSQQCPFYYKVGGIFGIAAIAYYVGRWFGLRSRLSPKNKPDEAATNDGDLQPEL
jgi:hypothetical protein